MYVNLAPTVDTSLGDMDVSFGREIESFVKTSKGEISCIAPAEDGVILMQILDAIYESEKTGKSVEIK